MGQDIGGVAPQNQRLQDVLRLILEPMQLMQVRQVIGEQVGQARGVPEMFGQRTTNGFPQSMDPMHAPESSGYTLVTYLLQVRSGWERPQLRIVQSGPVERQKS